MFTPKPVKVARVVYIGQRAPDQRFVPAYTAPHGEKLKPRDHFHARSGVFCGICLHWA